MMLSSRLCGQGTDGVIVERSTDDIMEESARRKEARAESKGSLPVLKSARGKHTSKCSHEKAPERKVVHGDQSSWQTHAIIPTVKEGQYQKMISGVKIKTGQTS